MMLFSFLSAQPDLENISMANAGIVAALGYAVVFEGLIVLMLVVIGIGKAFMAAGKKNVAAEEPVVSEAPVVTGPAAPGAAGELKLYDVEPKTAAMLMAIVADKMGKPLNELRFISVKEVK